MSDDPLAAMVAFLFQRSGRSGMSENELANAVSLDLKWYAPKAARDLIAGLVRAGWLQRDDEGDLEPTFDVKAVKVPIGFRPPREVPDVPPPGTYTQPAAAAAPARHETSAPQPQATSAPEAPASRAPRPDSGGPVDLPDEPFDDGSVDTLMGRLLERLAAETGEDRGTWVARMDAVVQRTEDAVAPEVALLIAAAKEGVRVDEWLEEARTLAGPTGSA